MDQRALGRLAEELAEIAALGTPEAARQLGLRVREVARSQRLSPQVVTSMVAAEWVRLGIVTPGGLLNVGSGLQA